MRLTACVQMLARHLYLRPGRTQAVASRLQDAGIISKTEGSRRYPDNASQDEIVALFIASITDSGLGGAAETAHAFAALTDHEGTSFRKAVADMLFSEDIPCGDVAIYFNPPAATIAFDGDVVVFGRAEPAAGAVSARLIGAPTVQALRADLQKES
ncbi:hypothetical protein B5M44_21500 [Shinella sumterensis]|uniref:hypothetical protein n=1 Tax=Shinella sumterensis TaxID=1967501 RepID=UPI00106E70AD|nr:hypothetical protein [Shinella sumterensis]MCD1266849.1 hypothetical protein [Shinella sumterensis]TFE95293.1 hypothetical protein B5M44_21500 [Shinella sumterensis]